MVDISKQSVFTPERNCLWFVFSKRTMTPDKIGDGMARIACLLDGFSTAGIQLSASPPIV
jgi:hypothetical protein